MGPKFLPDLGIDPCFLAGGWQATALGSYWPPSGPAMWPSQHNSLLLCDQLSATVNTRTGLHVCRTRLSHHIHKPSQDPVPTASSPGAADDTEPGLCPRQTAVRSPVDKPSLSTF